MELVIALSIIFSVIALLTAIYIGKELMKHRLVGFKCRRYDNRILHGRYLGYSNAELYDLSQRIINGDSNALLSKAYDISYTDVYDFSSKKEED